MMGDQPSINNVGHSNVPGMKYSELLMHFSLNSQQCFCPHQGELWFCYLVFTQVRCGVHAGSSRKRLQVAGPMQKVVSFGVQEDVMRQWPEPLCG